MKFKFNWVDVVIVLLVITIGLFGFNYLKSRKSVAGAEMSKLYFVFETNKNTKEIAEQFTTGTEVVFGAKKVDRGVITESEIVPYTFEVADTVNGRWYTRDIPGLYQARVRIEFDGYESENAYSGMKEQVMVGLGTIVSGQGVNSEGYVLDVGRVEYE